VSFPPFFLPGAVSPPADIVMSPCYVTLPLESKRLRCLCFIFWQRFVPSSLSRVKIEVLNSHCRRRSPSSDSPTFTLHYYKNVISTLATFPPLNWFSILPSHQSTTPSRRHRSFLLSSHVYHPSIQWYPRWRNNWPSFIF
jgi:hypothetical protein